MLLHFGTVPSACESLQTGNKFALYILCARCAAGQHDLRIIKLSEAFYGEVSLDSLSSDGM